MQILNYYWIKGVITHPRACFFGGYLDKYTLGGYTYIRMLDKQLEKKAIHRANIIRGQMTGLVEEIRNEVYCPSLLELSLSIQKSLKSLDACLVENYLSTHVKKQLKNSEEGKRAVNELIKIYNLSNK